MNIQEMISNDKVQMGGIEKNFFLIGLLSAFDNRFQASADKFFEEISWKQFFAIICINLCKEPPTNNELAEIMGSSHQNVKQILLKLEKKGFVAFGRDEKDKRKERIYLTEKTMEFCNSHDEGSSRIMGKMFEGIPKEDLDCTIRTIMTMEQNLSSL